MTESAHGGLAPPGFVIAAPRSGTGKTTVSLGLIRALRRRGHVVQPFKCGPDYIDPAFHAAAAGRESFNLDTWSMNRDLLATLLRDCARDADVTIVEGVMGLFDGVRSIGHTGKGATAEIAALAALPVLLVLDVSGQAETAAAVALGCARYRDDVTVAGVILNRVASARHLSLIRPAIEAIGLPVVGAILRDDRLVVPERHLGLVQAAETTDLETRLNAIADVIAERVDLDAVMALARRPTIPDVEAPTASGRPPGQRIALARDVAFSFIYPHVLRRWRQAGAEIVPFSPLADEAPDAAADVIWLPGGYPELHAGALASAARFRHAMQAAAERGIAIHGECGGFMALGAGLEDAEGVRHPMLGLLGLETSFAKRKMNLGYRRARLLRSCLLGEPGSVLFGHEFHYATTTASPDEPLTDCEDAQGAPVTERGAQRGAVTGSFFHLIDRAAR